MQSSSASALKAKDLAWMSRPCVSASYALVLLNIVAERGFDAEEVLRSVGLRQDEMMRPNARITPLQHAQITTQSAKLTGDDGISLEWGMRMRPTVHGYLGYAMLSCATLREAIELGLHYTRIRQRSFKGYLRLDHSHAAIELRELHPIGSSRHFFIEAMLVGHAMGLPMLVGVPDMEIELWFDYPEPAYYARYRNRLPPTRYSMPSAQVRFPARYLDYKLAFANQAAQAEAAQQCERELNLMGEGSSGPNLAMQVCDALDGTLETQPSLRAVASKLCLSDRTLKRKLQMLGTSFQELLDEVRQRQALHLLNEARLELGDIARLLGYQDPANFTRAFKRWIGTTPSAYRGTPRRRKAARDEAPEFMQP